MNDKDDKNLNINTGRDFIYTITHGVGAFWLTLIILIIVGGIVGGSIWNSNNQEQKNQQLLKEIDENKMSKLPKEIYDKIINTTNNMNLPKNMIFGNYDDYILRFYIRYTKSYFPI